MRTAEPAADAATVDGARRDLPLDATVIVCCYTDRRRADILAAVSSLRAQTLPANEIIIVVDHNPGLLAWLHDRVPDVTLVPNTGTRGLLVEKTS